MACLGIQCVRTNSTAIFLDGRSDEISGFNRLRSLSNPKRLVKNHSSRIRAAATVVSDRPASNQFSSSTGADLVLAERFATDDNMFHTRTIDNPDFSDKLEDWIQDSVTEIVKNIRQAPLLLQIYANGEVKTEKAVKAEIWPNVITERSSSPDGIILVEELGDNRDDEYSRREFKEDGGTRAFGVLIQGKIKGRRSDECKSACYLLKTSSVNGGEGIGFGCSHYCLMKVKSFRESASSQLNGCWRVD